MSRRITFIKKCGVLFFAFMLMQVAAKAATFTAVASGNFSSAATWGGVAPSSNITLDNIIIPSGITVTLDDNVRLNGLLSNLDVNGTLVSSSNSALILTSGTLSGAGTIDVDSIVVGITTGLTFTGTIMADDFSSIASGISTSADVTVSNQLWLASGSTLDFVTNGSLTVNNNATIAITTSGLLTNTGGSINLSSNYNVLYNGGNCTSGVELTGAGLQSVTVDLANSNNTLALTADVLINGTLSLQLGNFVLSGYDLVIGTTGNIAMGGSGYIVSTSSSDIAINANGGTAGMLMFNGGSNQVGSLAINVGNDNQTGISGILFIADNLSLASGTLNISNADVTLNGMLSGIGNLYGSITTDLIITTDAGLSTDLMFAQGGQNLNDLTIDVGTGTIVSLGSGLTVNGNLHIDTSNQFDISDAQLTLNGSISGRGTFTTNTGTTLILNTMGPATINFTGIHGTVGTFALNAQANTGVSLSGNLTVSSTFTLQNGRLNLAGNDLTLQGQITAGGNGTLSVNPSSDVTINATSSPSGGLAFTSSSNVLGSLTVNVGVGNTLDINSDLYVDAQLTMQGGTIDIDGHNLYINAGASVTGGCADNYIITSSGGALHRAITANNSAIFDVGTSANYTPATVELNNGSNSGSIGIGVLANVMAQGITGTDLSSTQPVVDATWHIESDITANLNMDLEVWWGTGLEVNSFNRAMAYVSHYTNGSWDATAAVSATAQANNMYSLRREGLTTLSPFAVFDENTATNIHETTQLLEFEMFPNPANTFLSINCSNANGKNLKVDIIDLQGSIISSHELVSDKSTISVSELAAGTYLARVYNANTNTVQRFAKQ